MLETFIIAVVLLAIMEMLGIKPAPNRSKEGYSNRSSQLRARRSLKKIGRMKW